MKSDKGLPAKHPDCRGNLNMIKYPCYAETKLDGEYNQFLRTQAMGILTNKHGTTRWDFPVTQELEHLPIGTLLLGELYYGGKSGSLYDFLSNKKSHDLEFAVFDIACYGAKQLMKEPYESRRLTLLEILSPTPHVHIVDTHYSENKEYLQKIFETVVANGYEGIVVKNANSPLVYGSCSWVKMKKKMTADLEVSFISKTQERIEVLVPASHTTVGVKVPDRIKQTLKVGDIVEIQYHEQLPGGSLRHPVFLRRREKKGVSLV